MKNTTLYLHIGHLKTGTSALQDFCVTHHDELMAHGICYPLAGTGHRRRGNHLALSLGVAESWKRQVPPWYLNAREIHPDEYAYPAQWHQAVEEIAASGCNKAILSSEFFFALGKGKHAAEALQSIKGFLTSFEVRVICYLRRPDRMIESFYNQVIKTGAPIKRLYGDAPRYRNTPFLDFAGVLRQWFATFSASGIDLRNYERLVGNDIVTDVFSIVDCPELVELRRKQPYQPVNTRVPHALIELKRLTNGSLKGAHGHAQIREAFSKVRDGCTLPPDKLVSVLSETDRAFLFEHTLEVNRQLRELLPSDQTSHFFDDPESILQTREGAVSDAEAAERFAGLLALQLACIGLRTSTPARAAANTHRTAASSPHPG